MPDKNSRPVPLEKDSFPTGFCQPAGTRVSANPEKHPFPDIFRAAPIFEHQMIPRCARFLIPHVMDRLNPNNLRQPVF
jgi:hypothetical protein